MIVGQDLEAKAPQVERAKRMILIADAVVDFCKEVRASIVYVEDHAFGAGGQNANQTVEMTGVVKVRVYEALGIAAMPVAASSCRKTMLQKLVRSNVKKWVVRNVRRLGGPALKWTDDEIDSFVVSQPTVKVDLSTMVEGKQTILLTGVNLQLPARISFDESKPAQIVVTLAAMVKKNLPVVPQLVGALPANLKIKQVKVVPGEIQAMIPPPRRGDKPLTLSTTPIYLNTVDGDSRISCKIIAPPTVQPVVKPWQEVEVVIDVAEAGK